MAEKKNKQAKVFTASLKPAWSKDAINKLLEQTKGSVEIYAITHNKDSNEDGTIKEAHTHFLIKYSTPRKIKTVANLFNVKENFIEVCHNFKACALYLTHKNASEKYQYENKEVLTNSNTSYEDLIWAEPGDKELIEEIINNGALSLVGKVNIFKLNQLIKLAEHEELREIKKDLKNLKNTIEISNQNMIDYIKEIGTQNGELIKSLIEICEPIIKMSEKILNNKVIKRIK